VISHSWSTELQWHGPCFFPVGDEEAWAMKANTADEIRDEVESGVLPHERSTVVSIDRMLARITRRPGRWRSRMRTRHRRGDEEHLSPLPSAA
jgi:hypothetical protein